MSLAERLLQGTSQRPRKLRSAALMCSGPVLPAWGRGAASAPGLIREGKLRERQTGKGVKRSFCMGVGGIFIPKAVPGAANAS